MKKNVPVILSILFLAITNQATAQFVKNPKGNNIALVVGENQGKPLLAGDLGIMKRVVQEKHMNFNTTVLENETATRSNVLRLSQKFAKDVADEGTFLFAFVGWTSADRLILHNQDYLPMKDVLAAIELGRSGLNPIQRFVFLFLGDKTYQTIDSYSLRPFYNEFIGLGMDSQYLVTSRTFAEGIWAPGISSMLDFKRFVESKAASDKAHMMFSPAQIESEPLHGP